MADGMIWAQRDSGPQEWAIMPELFAVARSVRESTAVFVPLLLWHGAAGGGMTMLAHEAGGLPAAVDAGLDMVNEHYGPPAWFAVCVDAYGRVTDPAEGGISADDLSDRFVMGDEHVVEQLMMFIAMDGVRVWRQVYRNSLTDGWEYSEPEMMLNPIFPNEDLIRVMNHHASNPR